MTDHIYTKIYGLLPQHLKSHAKVLAMQWDAYFDKMDIHTSEKQLEEFDAVMRVRVQTGSISLVGPDQRALQPVLDWNRNK